MYFTCISSSDFKTCMQCRVTHFCELCWSTLEKIMHVLFILVQHGTRVGLRQPGYMLPLSGDWTLVKQSSKNPHITSTTPSNPHFFSSVSFREITGLYLGFSCVHSILRYATMLHPSRLMAQFLNWYPMHVTDRTWILPEGRCKLACNVAANSGLVWGSSLV